MDLGYSKPSSHHIKASFQGRRSYSEVSDAAMYQQNRSLWLQPEASTLPKHRPYGEVYIGGAGGPLSARDAFEEHLRFEKQSSDEDDWAVPSPPSPEAGAIRCASFCAGFPIPDPPAHRTAASYSRAEHAQSWPSINVSASWPPLLPLVSLCSHCHTSSLLLSPTASCSLAAPNLEPWGARDWPFMPSIGSKPKSWTQTAPCGRRG